MNKKEKLFRDIVAAMRSNVKYQRWGDMVVQRKDNFTYLYYLRYVFPLQSTYKCCLGCVHYPAVEGAILTLSEFGGNSFTHIKGDYSDEAFDVFCKSIENANKNFAYVRLSDDLVKAASREADKAEKTYSRIFE